LRTPLDSAEKIKRKYGCASRSMIGDGDTMEVPSVGGRGPRVLPRSTLVEIIEPRVEEIFEHVKRELMRSGYADGLAAGIVLTGGATILEGTAEVAEQVLGLPVRRAHPVRIGGLVDVVRSPAYATGVGLVVYGASQGRTAAHRQQAQQASDRGLIKRAWSRLAEIF
jgi:cell division protein FtsA